jgi:CRISPR-associated protein Cst2
MNLARKSAVEFGWLVGIPEQVEGGNYFHVKLTPGSVAKGSGEASNVGQNIFYRPANSGAYAVVLNVDLFKVGYNNLTKTYALSNEDIKKRYQALLKSILNTFIMPKGAMRNTQNPHIVNFEGIISTSTQIVPAPSVSAINDEYTSEIKKISENLNKIYTNSIENYEFNTIGDFAEHMEKIINSTEPYTVGDIAQPVSV